MLVYALSTGNKIGLGVAAAAFIAFALTSSFLFPRFRSSFPGRGLPAFVVVSFLFFIGMLAAVEVFGAEKAEKGTERAGESSASESTTAPAASTTTVQLTTEATTTAQATTTAAPPPPKATTVGVQETEFKIVLASTTLKAGEITFDVENAGKIPHNLAVKGNGVDESTPVFAAGENEQLKTKLEPGSYELFCSVPGHKQAGMDLKIKVTG